MKALVVIGVVVAVAVAAGVAVGRPAPDRAPAPVLSRPPSLSTAGGFLLTEFLYKLHGRWAEAWQGLYPLHRRVANRRDYVACERRTPFVAPVQSIRVVRILAASVHVPGLVRSVRGAAVTVRVELPWYGPRDPITFLHTFHLVPVHGSWTWLLSPARYRLYSRDACSDMPAA
jgi:hypothetical protein